MPGGAVAERRCGILGSQSLAQLLGTGGVALLLLLSTLLALPALTDVALVLALLAVVAVASMTRREMQDG